VLGDDPPPRPLLGLALLVALARQPPALPHLPQARPPGGEHVAQRRLHHERHAAGDRRHQHQQRAHEVEARLELLDEDGAEVAAGGDRPFAPVHIPDQELEQRRSRDEQHCGAEAAAHDPDGAPLAQPPPAGHHQEQRHQQTGQPEETEAERRDLRSGGADPVARARALLPQRGVVEQARILGVIAAEAQGEEQAGEKEEQPEQLVALLGREHRTVLGFGVFGDGQRHGALAQSALPRAGGSQVGAFTAAPLRIRMKKSQTTTHEV
jgi:hypothetical protein